MFVYVDFPSRVIFHKKYSYVAQKNIGGQDVIPSLSQSQPFCGNVHWSGSSPSDVFRSSPLAFLVLFALSSAVGSTGIPISEQAKTRATSSAFFLQTFKFLFLQKSFKASTYQNSVKRNWLRIHSQSINSVLKSLNSSN